MDERLVDGDGLSDCLGSIAAAFIVGQMEWLERAVFTLEVLGDSFATTEWDLVGVQVKHLQSGVLEQVLHYDVESIVSKLMLPHGNFLESHIVLKHLTEMNGDTLANGLVDRIFDIQFLQGVVTGVEHTEDTNDTIMVNFVVAQIQG